ncbi:MAG: lyase [Parvularculaceae bacterium]
MFARVAVAVSSFTFAVGSALGADLSGEGPPAIDEWRVPFERARPRDPFAASGETVWFVGQGEGYLGRLDVASGDISRIDVPEGESPHNLIVGSDGIVWYAGNVLGVIGRYDPRAGTLEQIPMPDERASNPHTLVFDEGEENIWFTVQGGNFIGRLNVASRKVDLIPSKTPESRPYGVKIGPKGAVWVALFGTNKLARVDPETLALDEIELPGEETRPRRLETGADGRVWYVDYRGGVLGAYDPEEADFDVFDLPGGAGSRPYGTAMDATGRVWLVETGSSPNVLRAFDPQTMSFVAEATIPSGGGTVRHMHYHAPTNAIWFGADEGTIGRALAEVGAE